MTISTRDLFNALTTEERDGLKNRTFRGMFYVRGKKAAQVLIARGFDMEKVSAQMYCLSFDQTRALEEMAYEHGPAVAVVSISEKYSDNNGAWEVATLVDAQGREFTVGNMYDSSACFRTMSPDQLITYANKAEEAHIAATVARETPVNASEEAVEVSAPTVATPADKIQNVTMAQAYEWLAEPFDSHYALCLNWLGIPAHHDDADKLVEQMENRIQHLLTLGDAE